MNTTECIRTRRSIRKFKAAPVDHSLLESLISDTSYSPSWKNSQITRFIAIEDSSILDSIVQIIPLLLIPILLNRCLFFWQSLL